MALSLARDEFHWLLRHYDNPPPRKATIKWYHEEFVDRCTPWVRVPSYWGELFYGFVTLHLCICVFFRQIPELMFHMEELRGIHITVQHFWLAVADVRLHFIGCFHVCQPLIGSCISALVKKYNQVMQRYYVQYLSGYDAVVLNQLIQVSQQST